MDAGIVKSYIQIWDGERKGWGWGQYKKTQKKPTWDSFLNNLLGFFMLKTSSTIR